jgi:hypothetical protein
VLGSNHKGCNKSLFITNWNCRKYRAINSYNIHTPVHQPDQNNVKNITKLSQAEEDKFYRLIKGLMS